MSGRRRPLAVDVAASRKAHRIRARRDALREPRPTPRQLDYLRAMGVGPRPIVYLAAKLDVAEHTAGEMVRRLERAGWLEVVPSRRRRRRKIVQLTGPGVMACIVANARAFGDEMKAQEIHVGVGAPPICVVCGITWPCNAAQPDGLACLADDAAIGH